MNLHNYIKDPSITRLLWTGGWDSTFRLLQLVVEKDMTVLPIYIMDTARASTITEIKTMHEIRKVISKLFPQAGARILPTFFFSIHDIASYSELTEKYKALKQESYLGSQYDWLSRFATQHDITDLELPIHVDDKAYGFIKDFVVKENGGYKQRYLLDPNIEAANPLSLFSPFRFPLLEWSKVKMQEQALKIGTFEIMNLTWFCYKPMNGKPCGICNPCKYSIEEGMQFRFPKTALFRYKMIPAFRIYRKLRSLIR